MKFVCKLFPLFLFIIAFTLTACGGGGGGGGGGTVSTNSAEETTFNGSYTIAGRSYNSLVMNGSADSGTVTFTGTGGTISGSYVKQTPAAFVAVGKELYADVTIFNGSYVITFSGGGTIIITISGKSVTILTGTTNASGSGTTTTITVSSPTTTPAPTPISIPTLSTPKIQVIMPESVLVSGSKIEITSSVAGAKIYYTLDGTDPTSSSSEYNTASKVTINSDCTLKAIAIKDNEFSYVASCTYSVVQRKNAPYEVNDIVFKDGTAVAFSTNLYLTDNIKADAVALIFYKGTQCSNDGSFRTLGIGLKNSASDGENHLEWCLSTANGFNTMITTIQCTPSGNNFAYTFTGDKDGSDNLSQIAAFLANNGNTDDTGTVGNYPAFDYAKNYGSAHGYTGTYATGWYLPSIAELHQFQIWLSNNGCWSLDSLVNWLNSYFPILFSSAWSSSESDTYSSAYIADIEPDGYCSCVVKSNISSIVFAIREF